MLARLGTGVYPAGTGCRSVRNPKDVFLEAFFFGELSFKDLSKEETSEPMINTRITHTITAPMTGAG